MTQTTVMTTDERFQKVSDGEWWDTSGVDIVPEEVVDAHLADNPDVGVMVLKNDSEPEPGPS